MRWYFVAVGTAWELTTHPAGKGENPTFACAFRGGGGRQEFKRERKKRKRSGGLNIIKSKSSFWGRSSLIIEFTADSDVAEEVRAFRANANESVTGVMTVWKNETAILRPNEGMTTGVLQEYLYSNDVRVS